jgi:thiamine pyrophosphokinase
MARCVILSACEVAPQMASLLREDDFIIACDAGYRNCARLGCKANIIVGDFDSAPQPEEQANEDLIVLPHVKDDTDTEYAAKLAVQRGFDEVLLLGALGGKRLEHTLANLCTGLGLEKQGIKTTLCNERSRLSYVLPQQMRRYLKEQYFYFSVFPLEGKATGVELHGAFYPLHDATLTASYPLGVSNEYAEDSSCIELSSREGALLVVETIADV